MRRFILQWAAGSAGAWIALAALGVAGWSQADAIRVGVLGFAAMVIVTKGGKRW